MKRILTTLSQKWPEYLLEILVIVIGIYGAFALDNWNEERKIRQAEKVLLQNLKTEVQSNIQELEISIKIHNRGLQSSIVLLKLFGQDKSNISTSRLDTLFTYSETVWTFEPKNGTINSIISSGNLDYIQNDSLKFLITGFESEVINAVQEVEHIHRLLHDRLWPEIDGKINASNRLIAYGYKNIPAGSYSSDYKWLFTSRRIEDILSNMASWQAEVVIEEQEFMKFLVRFQSLINAELNRVD